MQSAVQEFDGEQALAALRSHAFEDLFLKFLNWQKPDPKRTVTTRVFKQAYRCRCIAQRQGTTVWQIKVNRSVRLSLKIRKRLYAKLHKSEPYPLLIFCDRPRHRSLWHWQQPLGEGDVPQSLVHIPGQPDSQWRPRLHQLWEDGPDASGQGVITLLPVWGAQVDDLGTTFQQQIHQLSSAIQGIDIERDRIDYATLLLARLMVVFLLQKQGLLDRGDLWYLHNKLGQCQQWGQDQYFATILQRLFHQGLSLPPPERSPQAQQYLGEVPFVGNLFDLHPLEQRYPQATIPDGPFESVLVWLGEPAWEKAWNPWRSAAVGRLLAQPMTSPEGAIMPGAVAESATTIDRYVMRQLGLRSQEGITLNDLLFEGETETCRRLIQDILPQVTVLDPACGVGTFLVAALQRLIDIYCSVVGHLEQVQDAQLQIWLTGLEADYPSKIQGIGRRLLRNALYGVDRLPAAVEATRLQLLMTVMATAQSPAEVMALPGLDFNILTGNSLIGLVRVDEASFDRGRGKQADVLQGNLLQPLVADSYRTILTEKNVSLEHYRAQNSLLQENADIPAYARQEFLRQSMRQLDRQAQTKLNQLLLQEFSQKLGIHYKETQLTDRPQRRLVTLEDLDVLMPFHWGYAFNPIIERGGFSVILSAPPWGGYRPTVEEFFQQFRDIAQTYSVEQMQTTKQALIEADPELAQAWLFYQSQFAFVADYFHRSDQYRHQGEGRTQPRLDWLFAERCWRLLAPQGRCTLAMPRTIDTEVRAETLKNWLLKAGRLKFQPLPPTQKSGPLFTLFWVKKPGRKPNANS
ncbi:MAG: hypothetical protein AAFZ80_05735 [Cyanobacteria bacterium P01_A01_bin.105]